jgi:protein-tyrosine-phosphatase
MNQGRVSPAVLAINLTATLCALAQGQSAGASKSMASSDSLVVFVCEHGAAKSVVAATYFNKLATDENLKVRAIARGVTPQEDIAVSAATGLRADGLVWSDQKPKAVLKEEISGAVRVVAFCPLPDGYRRGSKVEEWNDVPTVGEGYDKARDQIIQHLRHLLEELKAKNQGLIIYPTFAERPT